MYVSRPVDAYGESMIIGNLLNNFCIPAHVSLLVLFLIYIP